MKSKKVPKDQFTLFVDQCLNNPDIIAQLMGAFSLPNVKTGIGFDEHYYCAECYGTCRLKRGYGVESVYRMLSEDLDYCEMHNAIYNALLTNEEGAVFN